MVLPSDVCCGICPCCQGPLVYRYNGDYPNRVRCVSNYDTEEALDCTVDATIYEGLEAEVFYHVGLQAGFSKINLRSIEVGKEYDLCRL